MDSDSYIHSPDQITTVINFLSHVLCEIREKRVIFENLANDYSPTLFDISLKWTNVLYYQVERLIELCQNEPDNIDMILRCRRSLIDIYRGKYLLLAHKAGIRFRHGFSLNSILETYEDWKKVDMELNLPGLRQSALRRYRSPEFHPLHVQFMENFYFRSHMANIRWYAFFRGLYHSDRSETNEIISSPSTEIDSEPPNQKDIQESEQGSLLDIQESGRGNLLEEESSDSENVSDYTSYSEDELRPEQVRSVFSEHGYNSMSSSFASMTFTDMEFFEDIPPHQQIGTENSHLDVPRSISGNSTTVSFPDDFIYIPMKRSTFDEFEDLIRMERETMGSSD